MRTAARSALVVVPRDQRHRTVHVPGELGDIHAEVQTTYLTDHQPWRRLRFQFEVTCDPDIEKFVAGRFEEQAKEVMGQVSPTVAAIIGQAYIDCKNNVMNAESKVQTHKRRSFNLISDALRLLGSGEVDQAKELLIEARRL